jgi:branched-subunit amino acid transport protein
MNTLAVFAAAGFATWVLRVAFVIGIRSAAVAAKVETAVRYAAPAALSALTVTSLDVAAAHSGQSRWPFLAAAVLAAVITRLTRNLTAAIATGALTVATLTAL